MAKRVELGLQLSGAGSFGRDLVAPRFLLVLEGLPGAIEIGPGLGQRLPGFLQLFLLASLLVVCGFMFGPSIEDGTIEPISSASLAAYLFGAMLIVLSSGHADLALITFTLLVAAPLVLSARCSGTRPFRTHFSPARL